MLEFIRKITFGATEKSKIFWRMYVKLNIATKYNVFSNTAYK